MFFAVEALNVTGNMTTGSHIWTEDEHCHLYNSTKEFRAQLKTPTEEFFEYGLISNMMLTALGILYHYS